MESYIGEFKRCSGCKNMRYCSVECQKQDWNLVHKDNCKKTLEKGSQNSLNLLNRVHKEQTIAQRLATQARKFYIDNKSDETYSQQVVLCEISLNKDDYKINFDIINQNGIDNPPDEVFKRHLEQCRDKFLIIIHDLDSTLVSVYQLPKIE